MDDAYGPESTMLSDREKMRKYSEVDEFEDDNLSEEEEDNEENHHFDGTKLSKNPLMAKDPWTIAEDMDLKRLVEKYGPKSWSLIAVKLEGRIGKQCRERWHNHLKPAINKTNWSTDEDSIINKYQCVYGNKWAEIAKHLNGRTDNSIKNRYYSMQRKRLRHALRESELVQVVLPPEGLSSTTPTTRNTDDSPTRSLPGGESSSSSFPLRADSPSHMLDVAGRGRGRRNVHKRKAGGDVANDSQGIVDTSHHISKLQRLLKKAMSERSERELSGLKAAFYQHMEAQPSAVDSMDDFLLREYMLLLSAPWAKAIAEGIPGPIAMSPRHSIIPRLPTFFTEEQMAKWAKCFGTPHANHHFPPFIPELTAVGVRLPHWQVEMLTKGKADVFDGSEVVGVALKEPYRLLNAWDNDKSPTNQN